MPAHCRFAVSVGLTLLIITLIILFARPSVPRGITPLDIRIIGFTNYPGQARLVECVVSNTSVRGVWLCPAMPQVQSNGLWPQNLSMLPVRFTALKPKQSAHFKVACPTNAGIWKVPVSWVWSPSMYDWIKEVARQNLSAMWNRSKFPGTRIGWGFSEGWTNYTAEITE